MTPARPTFYAAVEDEEAGATNAFEKAFAHNIEGDVVLDDRVPHDRDSFTWNWRRFLSFCGPGLLMSIAFLDPGAEVLLCIAATSHGLRDVGSFDHGRVRTTAHPSPTPALI